VAIDTAAKRRSASGVAYHPLGVGVTPDATQGVAWRQQVAWSYSGIAVDGPSPIADFWCALTGSSAITGGGDLETLG
jgi:hypothetical protein